MHQKNYKIGFTGGGTGGHVYPIISLYQYLKDCTPEQLTRFRQSNLFGQSQGQEAKKNTDSNTHTSSANLQTSAKNSDDEQELDFIYFGCEGQIEERVAKQNQVPFRAIPFLGGMPRSLAIIVWGFKFLICFCRTYFIIKKEAPDLLFGTGGYAAAPVFLAARFLRIPYVVHNLDAYMGLANLVSVKSASALTLGMPLVMMKESADRLDRQLAQTSSANNAQPAYNIVQKCIDLPAKYQPKNGPVVVTGNPVRESFYQDYSALQISQIYTKYQLEKERKTIVITGGSQGAQFINSLILKLAPSLVNNGWQIIHQLGSKQYKLFEHDFPQTRFYKPFGYLDNLAEIYAVSDLAISRSGAMSVAELVARAIPAIFIPLPTAAQNHQFFNAKHLEEAGAGLLIEQKDLSPELLLEKIKTLYEKKSLFRLKLKELSSVKPSEEICRIMLMTLLR